MLEQGYTILSEAFKLASPGVKYTAEQARRKFLQLAIRIGNPKRGDSFSVRMEMFPGMDYSKLGIILNSLVLLTHTNTKGGKMLHSQKGNRERMCLKYAIVKSSGMTSTAARRIYGFENMANHIEEVEEAIRKVQQIREAIQDLASIEDKALCQSFGLKVDISSSDESGEDSGADDVESQASLQSITEELKEMLCIC